MLQILPRSPQAWGRVERVAGTFHGRLANELRMAKAIIVVWEEQQRHRDDASEIGRRVPGVCRKVSGQLDILDTEGRRDIYTTFGVKIQASLDELLIVVDVSENCTTTGRTLECPSGSKYSFVIVELKEVVLRARPRVVDWVPR